MIRSLFFLPRIAKELAQFCNLEPAEYVQAVWQSAAKMLPCWVSLLEKRINCFLGPSLHHV